MLFTCLNLIVGSLDNFTGNGGRCHHDAIGATTSQILHGTGSRTRVTGKICSVSSYGQGSVGIWNAFTVVPLYFEIVNITV